MAVILFSSNWQCDCIDGVQNRLEIVGAKYIIVYSSSAYSEVHQTLSMHVLTLMHWVKK